MPITVNWSDLEIAFERNSPDQESFLDLENGDLLSIVEGEPDAAARRARVVARAVPVDGAVRGVGVRPGAARTAVDRDRRQGRVPALQGCPARLPGRTGTLVRVSLGAAALPHSDLARSHEDRGRERAAVGARRPAGRARRAGACDSDRRGAGRNPPPASARAVGRNPGGRAATRARLPRVPARSWSELAARRGSERATARGFARRRA